MILLGIYNNSLRKVFFKVVQTKAYEPMPTRQSKLLGWIPLLITVLSTTGAVFLLSRPLPAEDSKDQKSAVSAPVSAFPIQIAPGFDGIVLIDPQSRNLCIYQYQVRNPAHERLTLLAARNFSYDLQLDDYNNADPRPATVKEWLQRAESPGGPIKKTGYEGKSTPPPKTTTLRLCGMGVSYSG